ncbi:MAG TPA: MFS transporter, partial [Polyangiaceae bacterium]|nr:MFS transporter [Polyangiaceae bacterium]
MTTDPPDTPASDARRADDGPTFRDGEPGHGVFGRERRALTFGVLLAVASFAAEGMGVVPALPTVVRELGGMSLFGLAFSTFMLAWLLGTVAAGQLADARGPGQAMAAGLSGFGAGLLLAAAARGMPLFLAGRALQGAGGGAMLAAAYVAVARGYPDALRARMMALTSSAWIVPAVCGPALSGYVVQRASWRLVFVGVVPLLVVTALVVLPPMRA